MNDIIAKPILKNKYWIVESQGQKIATIQAIEEGGYVYVHNQAREIFPSIKMLRKKHNIEFVQGIKLDTPPVAQDSVHGYSCDCTPHNHLWDITRKLPVYSKNPKSKSYFCAGYYVVRNPDGWTKEFCPKFITLCRHKFIGPFKTQDELLAAYSEVLVHDRAN